MFSVLSRFWFLEEEFKITKIKMPDAVVVLRHTAHSVFPPRDFLGKLLFANIISSARES